MNRAARCRLRPPDHRPRTAPALIRLRGSRRRSRACAPPARRGGGNWEPPLKTRCHPRWSWRPQSRHQFVAAGLGDEDGGSSGVLFDLLPKPINVGLERVRRHARIVAPNLLEQRFTRHRPLAGPVEITQDRRLLLGETDLVALGVEQELRTRPERIGTDRKDGVLARLVLAELGANPREQNGKTERLGHIVVGAGFEAQNSVGIGIVAGEHDDRRLEAVLAQNAYGFPAVDIGQTDVHDHEIDLPRLGSLHTLAAVLRGDRFKLLVKRQLLREGVAQLGIVVDDKNCTRVRHQSGSPTAACAPLDVAAPPASAAVLPSRLARSRTCNDTGANRSWESPAWLIQACNGPRLARSTSTRGRVCGRGDGYAPARCCYRSRSDGPASGRTTAKAMALRRTAITIP